MRLLIVEDETATRNGLQKHIHWEQCGVDEVMAQSSPAAALNMCEAYRPDIILSDIRMPGMTGIEMCAAARKLLPDVQIVFLSGYSDKEYLLSAINLSVIRYVEKPVNPQELENAIRQAVAAVRALRGAATVTQEELLLARFQQALHRKQPERLREIAGDIQTLVNADTSVGTARKLFFRFGCLVGMAMYPERPQEEIELAVREEIERVPTAADMHGWLISSLSPWLTPVENAGFSAPVARCVQLIAEHLASETLSVQWLAERVYLTPTYLSGVFKRELGVAPSQYILNRRMEQAKKLLENQRLSASQIAGRVGYADPKHFAKVFKRETAQTPTEYRRGLLR